MTWTVILIALMVGKLADWVPGMSPIPVVKIAFLFAVIFAYRSRNTLPPLKFRFSKITRAASAFLMLAIVSFVFSIYKSQTLMMGLYVLTLLLSMMLVLKVTKTLWDVEKLLFGFVAAGVSLALGLLLNYHGGRAFINSSFDPNDIAYALDTILPIVLVLRSRPSRSGRLLMNALAIMTLVAILLTGSRGGALGLCVVIVGITAFPLSRDKSGPLRKFSVRRALTTCTILLITAILAWGYLPKDTQERMATLVNLSSDYNADPNENGSRLLIWRQDVGMVLKRPIGYGLGSAELVNGLAGGQYRAAHDTFVQSLVELGALGLLFYILVLYSAWRELGRVIRIARDASASDEGQKAALYARALRMALVGNVAAGLFLSQAYSAALWMLLATAATLVRVTVPETRANAVMGSKPGATKNRFARERN
jgi:O-antigen ligase